MELQEVIEKRRAYRSLLPAEINEETIELLSRTAQLAPSCFNKQPWRYVFVKDKQKLKELFSALSEGNRWAKKASMIIAVFSHRDLDCKIKKRIYYLLGTGMSIAVLQLKASEMGLVANPVVGYDEDKAIEIHNILAMMQIITM